MSTHVPTHQPVQETAPSRSRSRRYTPMLLVIGAGLALTLGLYSLIRIWEQRDNQTEFDFASRHSVEAIRRAIEQIEFAHEILRGDFDGSPDVSCAEFAIMAKPILNHVPSLPTLQWAPRVAPADRERFEQSARNEGFHDYRIVKFDSHDDLSPADPRDEYFPIWYAATRQQFKSVLGLDFGSIPTLQASMEASRDTNSFTISPPVKLEKMMGADYWLVQTFLPVYRGLQDDKSVADRRAHLAGYLVGLCRVDELVESALNYASGPQGVDVTVFDEGLLDIRHLLHFHSSRTRWSNEDIPKERELTEPPERASASPASLNPKGIHYTSTLAFGGRQWSLVCTPAPLFFTPYANWRSRTLLAIGLFITYVASRYTLSATTRTERIQRLVDQRTHELRQKDEQLRQSQKLEAVGSLAGGIAHEFNNLLQAIGGYTHYAMEGLNPKEQPYQDLESVLQASDRAVSLTRQLLSFSRRQTVDRKHLDANEMVSDLTRMLRPLLGEHIRLRLVEGDNVGVVFADAGSFQQVLINLCLNARDAMPTGGEIVVKTERVNVSPAFAEHYADLKPGPYVELCVSDTGHGMTPEVCEHIFEPFFTTKPVGQGTGLGLPTVYGIVQQHEGAIHVYSEPDHGSTFKIYLPAVESEAHSMDEMQLASLYGGAETILVAEDDPQVRDISRRILAQGGYTVLTANDGEETLEVLRGRHREISLVLLDAVMPGLSGPDVYRRMKNEFPQMRVVFCSGYDPETAQSNFIVGEQLRLVEKPYNPEVLLRTVRELLDSEELCQSR